jgi:hypothetical protein
MRFIGQTCLAVLLLTAAASGARAEVEIKIRGNWVVIDEVYRAVIQLPKDARADQATAELVKGQLLDFLHESGYTLATARAEVVDGAIVVNLDEGRVEKVVFFGRGTLKTLQLKLDLNMPHNVFNRLNLNRQLRYLSRRHGVEDIAFELVPVRDVTHDGPQLPDLGLVAGYAVLPPGCSLELHIHLGRSAWSTGFGVEFDYDFPDGAALGVTYKGIGLLFGRDRWKVGTIVGFKMREELTLEKTVYPAISRAMAEWRWYSPPLGGKRLRPFLWLRSNLHSRQRGDIDVEIYYSERLESSLNLGYEVSRGLMINAGGGVQEKIIFGIEYVREPSPLEEHSQFRPFIRGGIDFVFDTGEMRRDRRHRLKLFARQYWADGDKGLGLASFFYNKIFELGYHDLEVGGRGTWLWGEISPDEEETVGGRYLRGVYAGRYWVKKAGGINLEFRMSLARDLFKISVFTDVAVFAKQNLERDSEKVAVGNSFGPGMHILIMDLLQFNLYLGFGFSTDKEFDYGLSASLEKAF